MGGVSLYEDGTVKIDDRGVTVKRYYFPTFRSKFVSFAEIRSVSTGVMSAIGGRWRLWGTSDFEYWFNLDTKRPRKDIAVTIDTGDRISAALTPDDPDRVVEIVRSRVAKLET